MAYLENMNHRPVMAAFFRNGAGGQAAFSQLRIDVLGF